MNLMVAWSLLFFQEKGGPIDSDNTYTVGAAPVKTKTAPSEFNDTVFWADNKWVMRKVRLPKEEYEVLVYRSVIEEKKKLLLVHQHLPIVSFKLYIALIISHLHRFYSSTHSYP